MPNPLIDTPDLMAAYAARVVLIPDFAGVSYPPRNDVPSSPWVMIRQSPDQPTVYTKSRSGEQVVLAFIEIVILVKSQEETPREQTRIDTLVAPVLDLFDANAVGGNINSVLDLDGHVDRVWQEAPVQRQALNWGSSGFCYAAKITLDSKFHRHAVPLEGTP